MLHKLSVWLLKKIVLRGEAKHQLAFNYAITEQELDRIGEFRVAQYQRRLPYMLSSLDLAAVNLFLITARKEIDKNNAYFVYYRNVKSGNKVVNARQASLDIGIIKISEILNHIKELQPSDYFRISRDREFSRNFNAEIYEFVKSTDYTYLIDWYKESEGHSEYFVEDETHLTSEGAQAYINCIKKAVLEVFKK